MNNVSRLGIIVFLLYLLSASIPAIAQVSPEGIFAVAWSPDGSQIVGGGSDGQLRIWDAETGVIVREFTGIEHAVRAVAWSPDGTRIASGDTVVRIWDVNGFLITSMNDHDGVITSVEWSPDGNYLVTATHSGLQDPMSLRIWDGNTYQLLYGRRSGNINSVLWNPNVIKSEIAVANENTYVYIETVTETEFQFFGLEYQNTSPMTSIAWNSDGSLLASGDGTGVITIWETATFTAVITLTGHTDEIDSLIWSPDDQKLASASDDNTIRVWDISSETTISVFQKATNLRTTAMDWNSTGLVFGQADSTVKMIQFPTAEAGNDELIIDTNNDGSELVGLDGSLSSDTDGTIVSYEWSENGTVVATGMTPQVDLTVGVHTITLTVTDDDRATSTDVVTITIDDNTQSCDSTIPISDTASLISAINTANSAASPYTICLENSTYTFNTADNSNPLGANALPVITGEIKILGNGATITRAG